MVWNCTDRLGQSSVSHIEVCTRYTTALWGALHYNDISLPPKAKWPPGVEPPPTSPSSDYLPPSKHIEGDKTPSGKKAEKESEVSMTSCIPDQNFCP